MAVKSQVGRLGSVYHPGMPRPLRDLLFDPGVLMIDNDPYPTEHADKFIWEPGDLVVLGMCLSCKWKAGGSNTCKAFPAGIPEEIQGGDFDHRNAHPGDHGIRFEAVPGVDIDKVWRLRKATP